MFKIKICGLTRAADAIAATDAGADAVGVNFYAGSRRFLPAEDARPIVAALPAAVRKVGVFVNASADEVAAQADAAGLSCVQLHGDEPAEMLAQLPTELSIVRAYRCDARGLAPLAEYLDACRELDRAPSAVLIDSDTNVAGEFGGTGRVASWELIARDRALLGQMPLVLAGGLTPENVAEAIDAVRPDGVDVASGVESAPGEKDPSLTRQFVSSARDAFLRYT